MSAGISKIIAELQAAVPPGLARLDWSSRETLRGLTDLLMDADTRGGREYQRYCEVAHRGIHGDLSAAAYRGRRILVTGGTGCIGSVLVRQLLEHDPAAIFCIYHRHDGFVPVPGVVYVDVDIGDEVPLREMICRMAPDIVFHCAAQRSPWLAEREVARTVRTNVVGTRNVLRSARELDVELFVHASTGKAMRYYTTDVYASSKKLAEWLVADYAAEGRRAGLARFTHVVDNAVVLQKVDDALAAPDGVIRLHDPDMAFYVQSAREAAQLLMVAGLGERASLEAVAIRSLGEPIRLLELMLGKVKAGNRAGDAAVYVSGHDKGYEHSNTSALYDPLTAPDVTPLVNAIEARTVRRHATVANVDRFDLVLPVGGGQAARDTQRLDDVSARGDALDTAAELARASRRLAEEMFSNCPADLFARLHRMSERAAGTLPTTRRPAA